VWHVAELRWLLLLLAVPEARRSSMTALASKLHARTAAAAQSKLLTVRDLPFVVCQLRPPTNIFLHTNATHTNTRYIQTTQSPGV